MKKLILMFISAMVAVASVNAQSDEPRNEIGLYYGFGSASNLVSEWTNVFSVAFDNKQSNYWGPVGIEYFHHVSPLVAIGAVASFSVCDVERTGLHNNFNERFYTFMPSVKLNWKRLKHFGMYSGLSAGLMVYTGDTNGDTEVKGKTKTTFMFQVTGFGMEFGGPFRGFAEFGFGEKGLLCAGVRYKF